MAPRKKKDEKESPASGSALILEYLKKQNRPYSVCDPCLDLDRWDIWLIRLCQAIDISTNLHGKVTKGFAAKTLKEMHERKEIEGRAAGKQIVYHALQQVEMTDDATATNSNGHDQSAEDLQNKTSALKIREKELREKLAALNAVIPITVLREQIASLEEAKASLILQISSLSAEALSDEANRVCKEDLDRIDQEWGKWKHQVVSRKRIFLEFWAICTEVLPPNTTQAELKEILGVEGSF